MVAASGRAIAEDGRLGKISQPDDGRCAQSDAQANLANGANNSQIQSKTDSFRAVAITMLGVVSVERVNCCVAPRRPCAHQVAQLFCRVLRGLKTTHSPMRTRNVHAEFIQEVAFSLQISARRRSMTCALCSVCTLPSQCLRTHEGNPEDTTSCQQSHS